jgi:hypothetical protein
MAAAEGDSLSGVGRKTIVAVMGSITTGKGICINSLAGKENKKTVYHCISAAL